MNQKQAVGHRQRLRDRFLTCGLDGFQDYEIVELLLTLGTPRKDCKQAAKAAIIKFGSLKAVLEADTSELQRISGIGKNNVFGLKIAQAVARRYLTDRIIEKEFLKSSEEVIQYLQHNLIGRKREAFMVIYLNGRNQIMRMEELFEGTLTGSAVYPREIVRKVIEYNAAAVVFVHNHPSGNLSPSKDDMNITKHLKEALATIDVSIHDHIIIAGDDYYSFADHGVL